jgi:hypothetical protein
MSSISKFIKVDRNVLIEYIYNDGNLISEPYNILFNSRDLKNSYIAWDSTATNNNLNNQLFRLDVIENRWGIIDTNFYSFLQLKNYSSGAPLKHDTIKIHIPINWTFGEYAGALIRVYTFDSENRREVELSNFYFDVSDVEKQNLLNFNSTPLLFGEKLWGKHLRIDIPAVSDLSGQTQNRIPIQNSINSLLTNGLGVSLNAPVFIDFHFIINSRVLNGVKTYRLTEPTTVSFQQTPDFERLGLKIEPSRNGDFFEIYGTYNNNIAEFNRFIEDSVSIGNRYYVEYNITMFEQNIRGKTTTVKVTDSFNESIEYRPIIKYSTTTAIIDVEMRLIDAVDGSSIIRRASYGMLQDEVSKYSLKLMKINLEKANKPKIYNIKNSINPDLVGVANSMGMILVDSFPKMGKVIKTEEVVVEQVRVPFPILVDRFNIMARSENSILDGKKFFGFGKMQIFLYPFDNIVKFTIAAGTPEIPKYFDLSRFSEINFIIKDDRNSISFTPFIESEEIDLVNGGVAFKISQSKFGEIKKIWRGGVNVFYITGKNLSTTTVIYTGLFKIYDDISNVIELNDESSSPEIIIDPTPPISTVVITPQSPGESIAQDAGNIPTPVRGAAGGRVNTTPTTTQTSPSRGTTRSIPTRVGGVGAGGLDSGQIPGQTPGEGPIDDFGDFNQFFQP